MTNKKEDDRLEEILARFVLPEPRAIQEISSASYCFSSVESAYGSYSCAEHYLEAFKALVVKSSNQQETLDVIINHPRDLTRKGLLEVQEWFDAKNFNESTLNRARKETQNQAVAARLVDYIRQAAIGDALLPLEERVDLALEKIKAQKEWSEEQHRWLRRLASSIKEGVVLDDDTFKAGNYRHRGGKRRLMKVFNDELDSILTQFNEFMWDEPA